MQDPGKNQDIRSGRGEAVHLLPGSVANPVGTQLVGKTVDNPDFLL
jgi:hypothetical protein